MNVAAILGLVFSVSASAIPVNATCARVGETENEVETRGIYRVSLSEGSNVPRFIDECRTAGIPITERHVLRIHLQFSDDMLRVYVPPESDSCRAATASRLQSLNSVVSSEICWPGRALSAPNDPLWGNQWSLEQSSDCDINLASARDLTTGSSAVRIGIIDSGMDEDHPDLLSNLSTGREFVILTPAEIDDIEADGYEFLSDVTQESGDVDDKWGHGTAVGSVAGACTNNGIGMAGVGGSSSLIPLVTGRRAVKYDSYGLVNASEGTSIDPDAVVGSLEWAALRPVNERPHVINMSLRVDHHTSLQAAVNACAASGILLIAATGNESDAQPGDTVEYPARYPNVLAVGATDDDDERAPYSVYGGGYVDVVAPGGTEGLRVVAAWTGLADPLHGYDDDFESGYGSRHGTSMAAPHVAGIAALVLSANSSLSNTQVREILCRTADKVGGYSYSTTKTYGAWDNQMGYGRVNAYKAVALAKLMGVSSGTVHS